MGIGKKGVGFDAITAILYSSYLPQFFFCFPTFRCAGSGAALVCLEEETSVQNTILILLNFTQCILKGTVSWMACHVPKLGLTVSAVSLPSGGNSLIVLNLS